MEEARERFHESWEVVRLALSGKAFSFDGKFTKIEAPIKLRPQLGARKPNFYGAVSSPSSAVLMAEQDLPVMALLNYSNDVLGGIIKDWRAASSNPTAEQTFPLFTHCYIADTVEEARAQAKKYLPYYYEVQVKHYDSDNDVWKDMPSYRETGKMMAMMRSYMNPDNLTSQLDLNLIGTPETITQRVKELADLGFNHLVIRNGTPGVPRDVRHDMMRRFAAEVMPHFQTMATKAA